MNQLPPISWPSVAAAVVIVIILHMVWRKMA